MSFESERVALDPGAHVLNAIEELAVPYELIECDPQLADTASFCEHYGVPVEESGNCIVVASKKPPKQYVACLVLRGREWERPWKGFPIGFHTCHQERKSVLDDFLDRRHISNHCCRYLCCGQC